MKDAEMGRAKQYTMGAGMMAAQAAALTAMARG
jgi:hypothetical protein